MPVRMVVTDEEWYYHRVDQQLARDLVLALEGWIDDADLVQVFENELGLFISDRFIVCPFPTWMTVNTPP